MSCEKNRERIVLLVHGELDGAARLDLEAHAGACAACAAALDEERRTVDLVARAGGEEPPADLLRRCREDLQRALRAEAAPGRGDGGSARAWPWRLRLSPAWALALLVFGFVAGRALPGARFTAPGPGRETASDAGGTIANVDFGDRDPLSERVSLTYDTLRRTSLEGTAGDPRIRRVLVDTVRDNLNAGLRLEAIDVLRRHADDREVRRALLRAVREDDNPGARLKALEAIEGRVADDPEVRDVVMQALLRDSNPGVRVRAIDALQETRSPETLAVLRRLADEDPNDYVRLRSAALVGRMPAQESVQ